MEYVDLSLRPPRGSVDRALDSGSEDPCSSRCLAQIALPVGWPAACGRHRRGPDKAGEWGGPCPVVGARKILGLHPAGQL